MSGRLQDKVAVITGGASGIGAATVRKFVAEGAKVVLADMQVEAGEKLAAEMGDAVRFLRTDVCMPEQVEAAITLAADTWGGLDCLFNNAGFGGVSGEIDSLDLGVPYQRTVDAMLTGPIAGMKYAAPLMKARGGGSIITTASVAGVGAGAGPHVYSAIKSAVINLSRSVAQELGPANIRVNTICPGGIATPIFAGQLALQNPDKDYTEAIKQVMPYMQPLGRAGMPEDIANAACFLAGDESTFITGHALVVDGGLTTGNWRHPDIGPSPAETFANLIGIDSMDEVETVYHAADD